MVNCCSLLFMIFESRHCSRATGSTPSTHGRCSHDHALADKANCKIGRRFTTYWIIQRWRSAADVGETSSSLRSAASNKVVKCSFSSWRVAISALCFSTQRSAHLVELRTRSSTSSGYTRNSTLPQALHTTLSWNWLLPTRLCSE